ncbi:hypothetical protein HDU91_000700 [Kappamyces sp. JEL0680]|nr:hypothetical protein HDU91_000700 [Kappamyces sp. JEL0680]
MSRLRVFCLPTLNNQIVFHSEFPTARNKLELGALKWRYQVSDYFASHWHAKVGASTSASLQALYRSGNRLTTRKASDEYFFKTIPQHTESIEFVYPSSLSEKTIQDQLLRWLHDSHKFTPKLVFFGLLLPTNFYIAKWFLLLANGLFAYHVFRLNGAFRAHFGSQHLQRLLNQHGKVVWTSSPELQEQIQAVCREASIRLKEQNDPWTWQPGQDIHDEAVVRLEKDLKLPELQQTVRRSRMQVLVHGSLV